MLHIGTSGWSYPEWRGHFYADVPQRRWLAHLAGRFTAVEVNATFYRQIKESTYRRWGDETPPGFAFAIKGHRFITHVKRLQDTAEPLRHMREQSAPLGDKLKAVLWQLPANFHKDFNQLEDFVQNLADWPGVRHVMEFRHASWFADDVRGLLEQNAIANAISDAADWPMWDAVTDDVAYVRLHGHDETYVSTYGADGLKPWAAKIRRWRGQGRDVHVYFDNTASEAAVEDAAQLMKMLAAPR